MTSIWNSYRSKCSISGLPGRGRIAFHIDTDLPGKRLVKSQKLHFRAEAPTLSFSKAKVQSEHLGGAPFGRGLEFSLQESKESRCRIFLKKVAPSRFTIEPN